MEGKSCQEFNFPLSPQNDEPGIRVASSGKSAHFYQNRSGPSALASNQPVQFELAENTRETVTNWIKSPEMIGCQFLFPSRFHDRPHISTRQYGRLVRDWVVSIGLEPSGYGTHSMRRTKVAEIYRKTGNLRAVQLLLGHTKVDSTVRYLGVELEDALSISERIDI